MILLRAFTFLMQNMLFTVAALLGMGFLIGFHELGHFLFCKLFNIRTPSFSIGFGPRLFTKKIGETEFSLSAIPLGGYVEIAGSAEMGQGEQKDAYARDEQSFAVKPYYQKLAVMLGGILFNLIFAYFVLIALFMIGVPKPVPVIRSVQETTVWQSILKPNDKIIAVNDTTVDNNYDQFLTLIRSLPDQEATFTVMRDGQTVLLPIKIPSIQDKDTKVGTLQGLTFEFHKTSGISPFSAIKQGIALTHKFIKNTVSGFLNLRFGVKNVQGPIAIFSTIIDGISQSIQLFLLLLALISINLAVLNLIPLPILDGGQLLYYTIEAIIGRSIPLKIREYIHIGSWLLLLALILYVSSHEIFQIIKSAIAKFAQ